VNTFKRSSVLSSEFQERKKSRVERELKEISKFGERHKSTDS
jgi:hypothetical protein